MPFLILDIETVPRPSIDSEVEIEITTINKLFDKPAEESDVYEKLQEISGEIQVLSAKLDGKDIV